MTHAYSFPYCRKPSSGREQYIKYKSPNGKRQVHTQVLRGLESRDSPWESGAVLGGSQLQDGVLSGGWALS